MSDFNERLLALQEQQTEILKNLYTKDPANQTTATPLHGVGNIFGCGVERDVLTAHIRPRGIASVLRAIPTLSEDPTYSTITGYTDVTGDELTLTNVCSDAPAGYMKNCNLTARFGLIRRDTQTIDVLEVIRRVNRGDFTDLQLHGSVLGLQGFSPSGLNQSQILNVYTMSEMVGVGVQTERILNTGIWQSVVGTAPYFPGLDVQIATAQVDADSNTACPALDSDVKDFTYNDVCGTGKDIVEYIQMMHRYLTWNAESSGLDPVQFVIAMRPNLWYELSACWPCRYSTFRCSSLDTAAIDVVPNYDAAAGIQMRDAMRAGSFLWVNGVKVPVVTDTGIYEHTNITNGNLAAGQYSSSIYFVPLTVRGNFPVTTLEYLDYRASEPERALLRGMEEYWWTDNGMYSWAYDGEKWCYKLCLRMEPRVVLRTPQLAGKIENVMYEPLQHLREPDPDSPYHYDGGVSVRGSSTRYAVWL